MNHKMGVVADAVTFQMRGLAGTLRTEDLEKYMNTNK